MFVAARSCRLLRIGILEIEKTMGFNTASCVITSSYREIWRLPRSNPAGEVATLDCMQPIIRVTASLAFIVVLPNWIRFLVQSPVKQIIHFAGGYRSSSWSRGGLEESRTFRCRINLLVVGSHKPHLRVMDVTSDRSVGHRSPIRMDNTSGVR